MSLLFVIPWEKAGKGISVGRQKFWGSDRTTSFTWGMETQTPWGQDGKQTGECQAENKEEIKYRKMPFPLHLLLPSEITAQVVDFSSVSVAPWWGVGLGLILLSLPPLGTQTKVPAVGLTAALGEQPVLVEECHREDAFTCWL